MTPMTERQREILKSAVRRATDPGDLRALMGTIGALAKAEPEDAHFLRTLGHTVAMKLQVNR